MKKGKLYQDSVKLIDKSKNYDAKEAIEVFRDELLWYFTEYQQRLDEEQGE